MNAADDPIAHRCECDIPLEHGAVPEDIAEHDHKWPPILEMQLPADEPGVLVALSPEVVERTAAAAAFVEVRLDRLGLGVGEGRRARFFPGVFWHHQACGGLAGCHDDAVADEALLVGSEGYSAL